MINTAAKGGKRRHTSIPHNGRMAKSLRSRTLLFSQPSRQFSFSSMSPSSHIENTSHYHTNPQTCSFSANLKARALQFLESCKTSTQFHQIQAHLTVSGLFQDPFFSGRLLKLSTFLSIDSHYTFLIFKFINFPDVFCVNMVIKSFSCSNYPEKAVSFYIEMLRDKTFLPNSFTFPPLISSCAKLNCSSLGQMCHAQVVKFGVGSVLPIHNSLIHFYACCGLRIVALQLFDEMLIKDLVTWNTMIHVLAKVGEMDIAHKLFDTMPHKNVVSWNIMLTGYLKYRSPGNVLKFFRRMMLIRQESNDTTSVNVITACGRSNRLKEGKSVHGFCIKMFPDSSLIVDTAILDMYCKCGRVDLAQVIFDRMPNKNLVSWNALILGYCIHENPLHGLTLFTEMVDKSRDCISPDEITFIGVLCACAREGMLKEGRQYFRQMIDEFNLKPNFAHYWCMANLLASVGLMQEAIDLLKNVPIDEDISPESCLWAGLLGSCRFLGDVELGETIARDLIERDPENVSYYGLLVSVYAVAGRWEEVAKTKDFIRQRGFRGNICSNLKDLKEIVHDIK